jgi:polar amino acid transport system substrate-binding protein
MPHPRLLAAISTVCLALLCGCSKQQDVIRTLDDAKHAKIGVMTGTTGDQITRARFTEAEIKSFDDVMDAVGALKSGQLDAVVNSFPTCFLVAKKNPDISLLPEPLDKEPTAVAMRKGEDELLAAVNRIVAELHSDGTLDSMKKRWFKQDLGPYDEPEIAIPTAGAPLRIGMSATREPMNFVDKDGRITGHDSELSRRIASKLHRPIVISNMKYMALIPALQSGKVDMVISGITATAERAKVVAFSQSYFDNAQYLLVRKAGSTSGHKSAGFFASLANSFRSNIIEERRYLLIWDGLKTTVMISIFSTIFGTLMGGIVCFMRMSRSRLLSAPAKVYISIVRGTPVLVLLMLIFYVVFASIDISPALVAVIAFGMNFGAYVSEIFRSGIEGIDPGQSEAGIAMGFSRVQAFLYVVLPQTVRRILPVYKGEFISLVKMTSIVGYIAVQDLTKASDIVRSRTFDAFFPLIMVAILYFAISWVLMQSLEYLERVTDPKHRRQRAQTA